MRRCVGVIARRQGDARCEVFTYVRTAHTYTACFISSQVPSEAPLEFWLRRKALYLRLARIEDLLHRRLQRQTCSSYFQCQTCCQLEGEIACASYWKCGSLWNWMLKLWTVCLFYGIRLVDSCYSLKLLMLLMLHVLSVVSLFLEFIFFYVAVHVCTNKIIKL